MSRRFWWFWVVVGAVVELVAVLGKRGAPLTSWARETLLHRPWGAVALGALLVWWPYHWLWVESGLSWVDAVVAVSGGLAGYVGWRKRS